MDHTQDRGLVLDPDSDIFKVDAYPDANFSGIYRHKNTDDPACAKIRTGFIIKFSDCPVLWISKFQNETSLSTTEAHKIALAHCFTELFPIINITQLLGKSVGIPFGVPLIKMSVHEDNDSALILSRTLTPKITPCSNYYATKMIWFREETNKRKIALLKIETADQLRYYFTKDLPRATLEYLRNKIMDW